MNGEDKDGDDDGVDVAQPHERRVQLVQMFLVDVVHESLPAGFWIAADAAGWVPWNRRGANKRLRERYLGYT